jgi:hypothetical protein
LEPWEFLEDGGQAAVTAVVVVLVLAELVVLNLQYIDFLALDVRSSWGGISASTAKAGECFGV